LLLLLLGGFVVLLGRFLFLFLNALAAIRVRPEASSQLRDAFLSYLCPRGKRVLSLDLQAYDSGG